MFTFTTQHEQRRNRWSHRSVLPPLLLSLAALCHARPLIQNCNGRLPVPQLVPYLRSGTGQQPPRLAFIFVFWRSILRSIVRTMPTPCQRIFLHSSSRYSLRLRLRILFHEAKSKFLICQLYGCNQYGRCVCVCVIGIYGSIPCTAIKYKNLFKPLEFFIIIVRNIRASHTFPTTEYKSHIFSTSRVFFCLIPVILAGRTSNLHNNFMLCSTAPDIVPTSHHSKAS